MRLSWRRGMAALAGAAWPAAAAMARRQSRASRLALCGRSLAPPNRPLRGGPQQQPQQRAPRPQRRSRSPPPRGDPQSPGGARRRTPRPPSTPQRLRPRHRWQQPHESKSGGTSLTGCWKMRGEKVRSGLLQVPQPEKQRPPPQEEEEEVCRAALASPLAAPPLATPRQPSLAAHLQTWRVRQQGYSTRSPQTR